MEYVGDNFGWDYVALGTDFLGIENTPKRFESVSKINELAELLGSNAQKVLWDNPLRVINQVLPSNL